MRIFKKKRLCSLNIHLATSILFILLLQNELNKTYPPPLFMNCNFSELALKDHYHVNLSCYFEIHEISHWCLE